MDDILSAALGQSGIDLSFLEESASESYDALHISSFPTVVSSRSETIKREEGTSFQAPTPSAITEEGDNLTDFLDLLSSNEGKAELSDLPHYQLLAGALTESFPCTMPPPNVPLGDEFYGNSDFENVRQRHQSLMSKVRSEPVLNNMPVAYHTQLKGKQLNASNLINFGDDSKRLNSPLIRQVGSVPLNLKPVLSTAPLPKVATDNERAAQSLQHMLNAGNLTVKEKHFLLKSAMAKASSFSVSSVVPSDSGDPLASLLSEKVQSSPKVEEDEDDDEEELIHAETFAEYMPTKLQIGLRHPDPVVETSSMASVSPPDIWYDLRLPLDVIDGNLLSALQLEAVVYACQQHEKLLPNGRRAGFLLGDGAGVGKGRTVAGIIYENYLLGRKRGIWLSVSNDLHYDAVRDLRDIGCRVKVHPLNKFKYDEKITSKANGKFKKGVVFSTYSALIGETSGKARFQTRLDQLLHWCGKDYDGVIILDECHKAKNLMPTGSSKPTKTGITVMKLQDMLPKARVVYCSATGASEPKNMAYMNRLGLWGPGTPFREFSDFIQSIEKRGVGAMEMVAMDMKLRGMYIARQLSFTGVTFDIQEVNLCPSFIEVYDAAVRLWLDARQKFEKAAELVGLDSRGKKTMWGQFWSAHQRFFKYLCIACKVKRAVEIAKEAINLGKCVIFGLQSTGEARTLDQLDELGGDLNDFISTTKGVFSTLVEKHFPGSGSGSADEDDKEFKENNAMFMNGVKKRRREWRKNIQMPKRPRRNVNIDANIETMSSSESDENESDTGITFAADEEASARLTGEDSDVGCDSDGDNSFKESSSDSDDEESWLRSVSDRKKPKKPDKSGKTKPKAGTYTDNTSMNVLAAAGFNLGKQYAWANASLSSPVSTENMKSNRTNKITAPHGLSKQLLALPSNRISSDMDRLDQCRSMKANLLEKLEVISQYLPPNTLDQLIDELGGTDYVAEMTGRKGRVVNKEDGSFVYEPRSKDDVPLELLNIAEKKRFMDGSKLIAVISEAASSGISLQADRREKNQRRRVHITLELPWSADKAIQQFGRSHRSNQVSAPEYLFLISELAGEQRFASIVAKRLESLGALTHGDRRATESRDLSRFNFDTKYGRLALDTVLKSVVNQEKPITPLPQSYPGTFMEDVREGLIGVGMTYKDERSGVLSIADKDFTNIARFMNRILGLTVALQNALFQYFTSTLATIVREAKRSGRWDEGIVDIGSQGESVQQVDVKTFTCPAVCGQVKTELVTVSVERGISFKKALEMHSSCIDPTEGFYLSSQLRNGKKTAVLIVRTSNSKKGLYSVFRPNVGLVPRLETLNEINKKYERVEPIDAESNWTEQYEYSESNCVHAFWRGYCKRKLSGLQCEVGTRKRTCHVLCGSVLSVWSKVESLLACLPGPSSKMQIIRVRLDNGAKLVGTLIPSNCAKALCRSLSYEESGEQALW